MSLIQPRPALALALGVYGSARVYHLLHGRRWGGTQNEFAALLRTVPMLIPACEEIVAAAQELTAALRRVDTATRARPTTNQRRRAL
jgi:hypothetical protein